MQKITRVLLSLMILVSMPGALFSHVSVVSSQTEQPYQVYLPLVSNNPMPSHFSMTWYVTTTLLLTNNTGKRNIYSKGV